jgi:hypothetical protein
MPIKAVTFDAYGTLLRNEDLMLIPRRIVADHGLSVPIDDVWRLWIDLYGERGSAEGREYFQLSHTKDKIEAKASQCEGIYHVV